MVTTIYGGGETFRGSVKPPSQRVTSKRHHPQEPAEDPLVCVWEELDYFSSMDRWGETLPMMVPSILWIERTADKEFHTSEEMSCEKGNDHVPFKWVVFHL